MAFFDTTWYTHSGNGSTTGYYAVPQWAAGAVVAAGALRRQLAAPAVGSERVFVCTSAGTTAGTEPAWVITRGGRTPETGSVIWQECTGASSVNGDLTSTPTWSTAKAISSAVTLGAIIQRNSGASYQICTTAGSSAATEPGFSNIAGATASDGSVIWTSLGPVGNYGAWGAPHARLANAFVATWGAAGHDFYLADNSAETTAAATTLSGPGTMAAPCRMFSVDHTAALPALPASLKPGASITTSVAAVNGILIGSLLGGSSYYYGINYISSAAFAGILILLGFSQGERMVFEACSFQITGALGTSTIGVGGAGNNTSSQIDLINCTFGFSNAAQIVNLSGGFHTWRNTPDPCITGSVPTALFRFVAGDPCTMLIEGVDLNALGGNTLVSTIAAGGAVTVKNCRSGTSMLFITPAGTAAVSNVDVVACDSGTGTYRNERHNHLGDLITSTTVVRTGGATDGVTPVSHMITPSAATRPWRPFASLPLVIWNDVAGANLNVTLYGVTNYGALQPNNSVWFDVEYMGSSGSPLGVMGTTGLATQLSATAGIMTGDSSAWDSAAPPRQNSFPYAFGATFRVAGNPGRVFFVYTAGTSAASEPAGYATATDGSNFNDGTAQATALVRFSLTLALTAPQPLQRGYLFVYPKFATPFGAYTLFLDPQVTLS